eukprot:TRINITY_DN11348_c0_g1_i1.p1 TRINITY_DN11348_c0_g1~~TRINITY_DN11348_c0_g1_i1.p1  ORF type:complete len:694 (-),score=184.92 TRINITY_DN11348_c0_g1_i1:99-2180(-)
MTGKILLFALLVSYSYSQTAVPLALLKISQNSESNPPNPSNQAADGDLNTFSKTASSGTDLATWQVQLEKTYVITNVTIYSGETNKLFLNDIYLEVVYFSGNYSEDFTSGTVVHRESKKNRLNADYLIFDLNDVAPYANMIRIKRNSTTGTDPYVLAMAEVQVLGYDPCDQAGCNQYAKCTYNPDVDQTTCTCNNGYYGNGTHCYETKGKPSFATMYLLEVTTSFQDYTLPRPFDAPVIVCTPVYTNPPSKPMVTRVVSKSDNTFSLALQTPDNDPIRPSPVYCIAVEQGVYDGLEAGIDLISGVDVSPNFVGTNKRMLYSYNNPVIIGQTMSANNPNTWSTFWSSNAFVSVQPADGPSRQFKYGLHRGTDNRDTSIHTEYVGYIVIEAGSFIDTEYNLTVVAKLVSQVGGFSNPKNVNLDVPVKGAVLSPAGMLSTDGYWPVVSSSSGFDGNDVTIAIDHDNVNFSGTHTDEVVSVVTFSLTQSREVPCGQLRTLCGCLSSSECGWCPTGDAGECYPNTNGSSYYCSESKASTFKTSDPSCSPPPTEAPVDVPPTDVTTAPTDAPVEAPTSSSAPTPVVVPSSCSAKTVCECIEQLDCAWCKHSDTRGTCTHDLAIAKITCITYNSTYLLSSPECKNKTNWNEAAHTLSSAFGEESFQYSAYGTLVVGCLLLVVSIIVFVAVRRCKNSRDEY